MSQSKEFKTLAELDFFCQEVFVGKCQLSDGRRDEQVAIVTTIQPLTMLFEIPFPLTIEHRDRPDFLINFNQALVTIEVVRLIAKSRAYAVATAKRHGVDILFSRYTFSTPEMTRVAMEESISNRCAMITDFESIFDENYVDAFISLVNEKRHKILQNADCCIAGAENWLLIKDEHRLGVSQADFVASRVHTKMCDHWSSSPHFARIIFATNAKLFVFDGCEVLSFSG